MKLFPLLPFSPKGSLKILVEIAGSLLHPHCYRGILTRKGASIEDRILKIPNAIRAVGKDSIRAPPAVPVGNIKPVALRRIDSDKEFIPYSNINQAVKISCLNT